MNLSVITASNNLSPFIGVTEEFKKRKAEIIAEFHQVNQVTCATERQILSDWLVSAAQMIKDVNHSEKVIGDPVWVVWKNIKAVGNECRDTVEQQIQDAKRTIASFDNAERVKAEAEAKRLRDEAARKENERQKAIQDARNAATEEQRAEQLKLAEQLQSQAKAAQAAVVAAPPKPAGVSSRKVWKFTVTDIKALYTAKPELCEVTHSQSRINAAIAGGMRECAGLTIYEDTQINAR